MLLIRVSAATEIRYLIETERQETMAPLSRLTLSTSNFHYYTATKEQSERNHYSLHE